MSHHFRKHHLILGLLALVVAVSLLYSYTTLRVGNITQVKPPVSAVPGQTTPGAITPGDDTPPAPKGVCRPSGCSGEICSDENMVSNCIYRAEFACYKNAACERQADGRCGWTVTPRLRQCLTTMREESAPMPQ